MLKNTVNVTLSTETQQQSQLLLLHYIMSSRYWYWPFSATC